MVTVNVLDAEFPAVGAHVPARLGNLGLRGFRRERARDGAGRGGIEIEAEGGRVAHRAQRELTFFATVGRSL